MLTKEQCEIYEKDMAEYAMERDGWTEEMKEYYRESGDWVHCLNHFQKELYEIMKEQEKFIFG